MESQDELLKKVRQCMSRNMLKLVAAIFFMVIMTSAVNAPITLFVSFKALFIPLLFFCGAITYIVQYGFFVFVLRLYHEQETHFRHLFAGFCDFKRAFLAGLFFTLVSVGVVLLFSFVTILETEFFMVLVLLVIFVIFYILYGFVWFLLYNQPELKLREAFKQSALITKGERRNFIWFCIKSTGYYLLIGVAAIIVFQVLLNTHNPEHILIMPLTMISGICAFASFIRISIAFVAWYTSHND